MELEPEVAGQDTQTAHIADLPAGMILEQEVRTNTGLLVAAKGQEVTPLLLLKLKSYSAEGAIADEVAASTPKFAQ